MTPPPRRHRLEVVAIETGEVVHVVDLRPGCSERHVEQATRGLLRNLNRDRYFVREEGKTDG